MKPIALRFDRGTLELGAGSLEVPGAIWDPRTETMRISAHRLAGIVMRAEEDGLSMTGDPRETWRPRPTAIDALDLRPYQRHALAAWDAFDRRGVVVLPTGAGKTHIAIAAILHTGLPAAILCPTRALAAAWVAELSQRLHEPIGLVGDGERQVERITVLTFESAFRHMDRIGDRFGLIVVDEVHHFGGGGRSEALEASCAIARLGLTATAPDPRSNGAAVLDDLVGPVVFELGIGSLVGTYLAPLQRTRIFVKLEPEERAEYDTRSRAFSSLRRAFLKTNPRCDLSTLLRGIASSPGGAQALRDHARAEQLASFPRAKRELVTEILRRHRADRTIVFTAFADNAYAVGVENLVPVITGETEARERTAILEAFREGRVRAIASARVLNEGIDVPDARVAIVAAGVQGRREHIQRVGRVLRPAPGKEAVVYELVTADTTDARRAHARTARHAPHTPS